MPISCSARIYQVWSNLKNAFCVFCKDIPAFGTITVNIHACVSYWYQLKSLWKEELTDFNKSPVICRSIQGKHRSSYSQMNDWSLFLVWKTVCSDAPPINLPLRVESISIQGSNNKQGQFDYSLLSEASETSIFWG